VRPGTIIEIGSFEGGSAYWLSDQCTSLGLDTQVISIDINPPPALGDSSTENVKFLYGDVYNLFARDLTEEISKSPRPFLYIDDGPHDYEGCIKALQFFDYFAQSNEYIVIEDGILKDLKSRKRENGPNRAIKKFLASNDSYFIDRSYCDFFGYNVTWNTNGYIVKK
jgi:cephalosporin hydroxylase